jgi:hypothetical protein
MTILRRIRPGKRGTSSLVRTAAKLVDIKFESHVSNAVLDGITAFLDAPRWSDAHGIVKRVPQLLSEDADRVVCAAMAIARQAGNEEYVSAIFKNREVLQSCRAYGVEVAFAEKAGWTPLIPADLTRLYRAATSQVPAAIAAGTEASLHAALTDCERLLNHPAFAAAPAAFTSTERVQTAAALLGLENLAPDDARLDRAIELLETTDSVLPQHAPQRAACLGDLASALSRRSGRTGDVEDLRRGAGLIITAAELGTPFSPNRDTMVQVAMDGVSRFIRRTAGTAGPDLLDRLIILLTEDLDEGPGERAERSARLAVCRTLRQSLYGDR